MEATHPVCISLEICLFQRKQQNKWPAWHARPPACQSAAGRVEASPRVSGAPSVCGSGVSSGASYCTRDRKGRKSRQERVHSHSWPRGDRRQAGCQDDIPSPPLPSPPRPSPPLPVPSASTLPHSFYTPPSLHPTLQSILTWGRGDAGAEPNPRHSLAPPGLGSSRTGAVVLSSRSLLPVK